MKHDFRCLINGVDRRLIEHDVRLFAGAAGTASLKVVSEAEPEGSVFFSMSVNNGPWEGCFYGYVERAVKTEDGVWVLFCREKIAALDQRLSISMRNVSMKEVLFYVSDKTGIKFSMPKNAEYLSAKVAHFVCIGSALQAVRAMAGVFNIDNFVCQQRRDGNIYVGSWLDGGWNKGNLSLPDNIFENSLSTESVSVVAIPGLRPNHLLNGRRVASVVLKGVKMVVSWKRA